MNLPPLAILDGATGTELNRRGVDTRLPLWSAAALMTAPEVVRDIHYDYLRAGANILTANTFRTHRRSLARGGLGERAAELTALAVDLARQAIARISNPIDLYVAGSMAPLEDCYSPELTPPQAECEREHAELARHLAGADLILVETMPTIREARAAAQASLATGKPVLVSFVCRSDGRLFSGESVTEAVRAIAPLGVQGLLINCTPSTTIHQPFAELVSAWTSPPAPLPTAYAKSVVGRGESGVRSGLYANIGHTDDIQGWTSTADVTPEEYARLARGWREMGADIIGGCCGTTPAHIAALKGALK